MHDMHPDRDMIWLRQEDIEEATGLSYYKIGKAIDLLESKNLIYRERETQTLQPKMLYRVLEENVVELLRSKNLTSIGEQDKVVNLYRSKNLTSIGGKSEGHNNNNSSNNNITKKEELPPIEYNKVLDKVPPIDYTSNDIIVTEGGNIPPLEKDLRYILKVARYILSTEKYSEWDNIIQSAKLTEDIVTRTLSSGNLYLSDKQRDLLNKKVLDFNTVFEDLKDMKLNQRMNKLNTVPSSLQSSVQEWFRNNPIKTHKPRF